MKQFNVSSSVLALMLLVLMAYSGPSQEPGYPTFALKIDPKLKSAPIEITGIGIGGKSYRDLNRIPYTPRSIEELEVSFRNVSNKPIAFVRIAFVIKPTGDMNHGLVFVALAGSYPVVSQRERDPQPMIEHADTAVALVNARTAESFSRRLREAQVTNIGHLKIESVFIAFSDGTAWEDGKTVF